VEGSITGQATSGYADAAREGWMNSRRLNVELHRSRQSALPNCRISNWKGSVRSIGTILQPIIMGESRFELGRLHTRVAALAEGAHGIRDLWGR
jgi:hypothetical protein